ncbi:hypothetical protein [Sphingomonas sp. TZW2008]|uniref:hypothetical protein n=1 Tax=Sphingomonas sp. TZW2008 TaxID=1917973 RepID=UPI00118177C1|nr:hypothetical protein [Sphingomonas sp. TZW2008]
MQRWLICPGLPRSGTTFLFDQFATRNRQYFNVPEAKEVHWLEREPPAEVGSVYPNASDGKIFLDFSPGYSGYPERFKRNLEAVPKDGSVQFIVALRDPVEQAFAHYLHDVASHVVLDWAGDLRYPFFGQQQMMSYFVERAEILERIAEDYGNNALFLNFHNMFRDLGETAGRIAELIGVDTVTLQPERVGEGGWLPRFIYGGADGVDFIHDDAFYSLPARSLLLINGAASRFEGEISEEQAQRLIAQSTTWQRELSAHVVDAIATGVFDRTIASFSALLGEDIAAYRASVLRAKQPPLPNELADMLLSSASLTERLRWGRWLGTLDK